MQHQQRARRLSFLPLLIFGFAVILGGGIPSARADIRNSGDPTTLLDILTGTVYTGCAERCAHYHYNAGYTWGRPWWRRGRRMIDGTFALQAVNTSRAILDGADKCVCSTTLQPAVSVTGSSTLQPFCKAGEAAGYSICSVLGEVADMPCNFVDTLVEAAQCYNYALAKQVTVGGVLVSNPLDAQQYDALTNIVVRGYYCYDGSFLSADGSRSCSSPTATYQYSYQRLPDTVIEKYVQGVLTAGLCQKVKATVATLVTMAQFTPSTPQLASTLCPAGYGLFKVKIGGEWKQVQPPPSLSYYAINPDLNTDCTPLLG